eukprot:TRINITY_DN39494_c0_g1_i1.p1 TRINITY_DN39494_c0_g1~~TRINITY_DN39494_c0_g1_i1.p1  ORF type:complete len:371 (-),score=87.60 TRINITY_DN39494_c0_g1_i1:77-1189(-)
MAEGGANYKVKVPASPGLSSRLEGLDKHVKCLGSQRKELQQLQDRLKEQRSQASSAASSPQRQRDRASAGAATDAAPPSPLNADDGEACTGTQLTQEMSIQTTPLGDGHVVDASSDWKLAEADFFESARRLREEMGTLQTSDGELLLEMLMMSRQDSGGLLQNAQPVSVANDDDELEVQSMPRPDADGRPEAERAAWHDSGRPPQTSNSWLGCCCSAGDERGQGVTAERRRTSQARLRLLQEKEAFRLPGDEIGFGDSALISLADRQKKRWESLQAPNAPPSRLKEEAERLQKLEARRPEAMAARRRTIADANPASRASTMAALGQPGTAGRDEPREMPMAQAVLRRSVAVRSSSEDHRSSSSGAAANRH